MNNKPVMGDKSAPQASIPLAAALRFEPDKDNVPRVVAVGKGDLARQIVLIAEREKIPIHRNEELAAALCRLSPGSEIPPELYLAVAQVIVFISQLNSRYAGRLNRFK